MLWLEAYSNCFWPYLHLVVDLINLIITVLVMSLSHNYQHRHICYIYILLYRI